MAGGIGFRPINRPPAFIYMDLGRSTTTGALKCFMDWAADKGSDRRRIWPKFEPFTVTARDALRASPKGCSYEAINTQILDF
jgi:hypothetical protein